MLRNGAIRPSTSAFASPVRLLAHHTWFCMDYCHLVSRNSVFFGDDRSSREFLLRACPPPVGRLVNVDPMEERNEARLLVRIFAVKRIGTGVAGRCPSWRHARQPKKKMARATSSPCRVGISLALAWPEKRSLTRFISILPTNHLSTTWCYSISLSVREWYVDKRGWKI
jgi:hypothetical protein